MTRLRTLTGALALALALAAPPNANPVQTSPRVKTFRIRITTAGHDENPASGSALYFNEEVIGTIAFSPSGDFEGEHYLGTRATRRFHGVFRGMTAPDQGQECAWLLDTEGPARVELRAVEPNAWEVAVETSKRGASIQADKGSCPASQLMPDIPFLATVAGLEGPVPLDAGHVYRAIDNGPEHSMTLKILDVCEGDDFRDGPKDPRSESVRRAVAAGLNANGAAAGPEIVGITSSSVLEFNVRLGPGHVPLPNRACLQQRIDAGEIREGTLTGAEHLLVGAVQESGGKTRVTVRTVDAVTGEVAATGKADASGPDALGQAMRGAFSQLGWGFGG